MLVLLALLEFVSALPSGIYLATAEGDQYFNPVHKPHTKVNIPVAFSTCTSGQVAVSTGRTVFKGASANETKMLKENYAKSLSLALA